MTDVVLQVWQAVPATSGDEGMEFSASTLIFIVLGAIALIIVCMLGPISRIYDHRAERRQQEREAAGTDRDDTA